MLVETSIFLTVRVYNDNNNNDDNNNNSMIVANQIHHWLKTRKHLKKTRKQVCSKVLFKMATINLKTYQYGTGQRVQYHSVVHVPLVTRLKRIAKRQYAHQTWNTFWRNNLQKNRTYSHWGVGAPSKSEHDYPIGSVGKPWTVWLFWILFSTQCNSFSNVVTTQSSGTTVYHASDRSAIPFSRNLGDWELRNSPTALLAPSILTNLLSAENALRPLPSFVAGDGRQNL